jgi:N-acetylglucosaminyldiphosphoundecaprenol N-acetyl-beta-D-mannosaminyltransferase
MDLSATFDSPRVRILGGDVDPLTPDGMLAATEAFVAGGGTAVIANHNAHSLALLRQSAAMRAFFDDADLVQIDSLPMILWGRLMGQPVGREHRSTYLDWSETFWDRAARCGWRVFHVGGEPGVGAKARQAILERHPGVVLEEHHGYFNVEGLENHAVLRKIAEFGPDIILVGMGMPRQEAWIAANRYRIGRGVFFPVGAAFDYEAGVQPPAPRWMGKVGLEWLFRLVSQPGRLAYRYLVEPWSLTPAMLADLRASTARR